MNKKLKVIIAKELIILLTGIVVFLFVIGFTIAVNYYYKSRIISLNNEIALNDEKILKNYSTDFLKIAYENFKSDLIVSYILEGDSIDVQQKSELEFLKIYSNAKKLQINRNGYEQYKNSYIFNYIEFDNFDSLIHYDKFYRTLVFEEFHKSFNTKDITELDSILETRNIMKNEISKLTEENSFKTIQIHKYSDSKFSKLKLITIFKWSLLIIILTIYPLRILFQAFLWAIKTLK